MNTVSKTTWASLVEDSDVFGKKLTSALSELEILEAAQDLEADHICVRLGNGEDVETLKEELRTVGKIISLTEVNGREISMIQLDEPLAVAGWSIYGVELPYPKPNHTYKDGWQHVEFVLSGAENTMDGVKKAMSETFPTLDFGTLKTTYGYSEETPHAKDDQMPNPSIGIKVGDVGIKFHAQSIQEVVGYSG